MTKNKQKKSACELGLQLSIVSSINRFVVWSTYMVEVFISCLYCLYWCLWLTAFTTYLLSLFLTNALFYPISCYNKSKSLVVGRMKDYFIL